MEMLLLKKGIKMLRYFEHFLNWSIGIFLTIAFIYGCGHPAGQDSINFSPEIEISFDETSIDIDNIQISNNYGYYLYLNNVEDIQEYKEQLEFTISKLNELEEKMKLKNNNSPKVKVNQKPSEL